MPYLVKLKQCTSLSDLANLLGYKPKSLSYILYFLPNKYTEFTIPKKNGGVRYIDAPREELNHLQSKLSKVLYKCFEEIHSKADGSLSHGFRKHHSIITNAENHKNKRHVFNVDLEDFFPSINFGRVRGFFIKDSRFLLNPAVATVIAQIACYKEHLPQGSPCSPVISNFIGHILDMRMVNLARSAKCTYSRYADDLTFSTNQKEFPACIAVCKDDDPTAWKAGKLLKKEIKRLKFKINEGKTSLQNCKNRQIATGLIVNKKVNIKREYYKLARSMCYSLFNTGEFFVGGKEASVPQFVGPEVPKGESVSTSITAHADEIKNVQPPCGELNQLEGILSFIYQVKGSHDNRKCEKRRYNPNNITQLYREFLFYKHFFNISKPLIICEGKTDVIYLKCAINQLQQDFNLLVKKTENSISYEINFLKITKNIKHVFGMSEGTPGLVAIMDIYKHTIQPFKGNGKAHPVILVVDNDSGADEIKKKLNNITPTANFYHYVENLYVVLIPSEANKKDVAIEDLFDEKTLSTLLEGKKFNKSAKINPKTDYGKIVFAEKIVNAGQSKINFDGFKGLLNAFEEVIKAHPQKMDQKDAAAHKVKKFKKGAEVIPCEPLITPPPL